MQFEEAKDLCYQFLIQYNSKYQKGKHFEASAIFEIVSRNPTIGSFVKVLKKPLSFCCKKLTPKEIVFQIVHASLTCFLDLESILERHFSTSRSCENTQDKFSFPM